MRGFPREAAVWAAAACALAWFSQQPAARSAGTFTSDDVLRVRSVGDAQMSPDGGRIVYTVLANTRSGRPTSELYVWNAADGSTRRLGGEADTGTSPRWSPDGQWVAYVGRAEDTSGLALIRMDGSAPEHLARIVGTNHPLPSTGDTFAWSSGSSRIAFASGVPGPEGDDANGDPMVITRYLYKPTASEGLTRFNDNRRLQIFMVDLVTREPRQMTDDTFYNHSLAWSPKGDDLLFVSNREADPDRTFNYDVFNFNVAKRTIRRLTETKSAEYRPVWSPDGTAVAFLATTRSLTSSETTMEDTHVWVMKADGSGRRELAPALDNRHGAPKWSPDGGFIGFTVQERGNTRLYRVPAAGGPTERLAPDGDVDGTVGAWSLAKDGALAYTFTSTGRPAELYFKAPGQPARQVTQVAADLPGSRSVAPVDRFTFKALDGLDVEAFLTRPAALDPGSRHPLIVMIHGGPHGQQGPAFNLKAQVYASRGWATLMVNYRGSTGYGQRFADAIAKDQNGAEARDVLAGVDAALARYPWLDASRLGIEGGSYGGQLTNWIVTQTDRFKAAIPSAGIVNLVSFNYMAYYHDYLAVEFGSYPHENGLMDVLWQRSPLRLVHQVRTPVLILHGENDNDVPIAEAEQWFIALKDVGIDTVMVRYPREGHGIREPRHVKDALDRSVEWYERYFEGK